MAAVLNNNRLAAMISFVARNQGMAMPAQAKDLAGMLTWAENKLARNVEKKMRYGWRGLLEGKHFHHASVVLDMATVYVELHFRNNASERWLTLRVSPVAAHELSKLKEEERQERLDLLYEQQQKLNILNGQKKEAQQ